MTVARTVRAVGTRAEQREETRERIVLAAVEAFAELGFRGTSTREIAQRAGVNQGLLTYYFGSKDELWKTAANRIFDKLRSSLAPGEDDTRGDQREAAREAIRRYVRFSAAHPELFRFMVEEGKRADDRMKWLVDTHVTPFYEAFGQWSPTGGDRKLLPHAYYALAGAASLIFATAPECRRLTGIDPTRRAAIEAHAEYVAELFIG